MSKLLCLLKSLTVIYPGFVKQLDHKINCKKNSIHRFFNLFSLIITIILFIVMTCYSYSRKRNGYFLEIKPNEQKQKEAVALEKKAGGMNEKKCFSLTLTSGLLWSSLLNYTIENTQFTLYNIQQKT